MIPSVSGVSSILSSLRHPRKNRSISIGPQSEADAYEILAFRDRRRRASADSVEERPRSKLKKDEDAREASYLPTPPSSKVDLNAEAMAGRSVRDEGGKSKGVLSINRDPSRSASQGRRDYEKDEREVFSKLERPRVRYDVEVITKLIVYTGKGTQKHSNAQAHLKSGIAWLAVEGNPLLFELLGLGMPQETP